MLLMEEAIVSNAIARVVFPIQTVLINVDYLVILRRLLIPSATWLLWRFAIVLPSESNLGLLHFSGTICLCGFHAIFSCFETQDSDLVFKKLHCGSKCPKFRSCDHPCVKSCHSGSCDDFQDGKRVCEHPCPKLKSCSHPCPKTCHDGPCDTSACIKLVAVRHFTELSSLSLKLPIFFFRFHVVVKQRKTRSSVWISLQPEKAKVSHLIHCPSWIATMFVRKRSGWTNWPNKRNQL